MNEELIKELKEFLCQNATQEAQHLLMKLDAELAKSKIPMLAFYACGWEAVEWFEHSPYKPNATLVLDEGAIALETDER